MSTYREPSNEELWHQQSEAIPPSPAPQPPVPMPLAPLPVQPPPMLAMPRPDRSSLALAIASLGIGIPLTAIAASVGLPGLIVAWLGIVGVNAVFAWSKHQAG